MLRAAGIQNIDLTPRVPSQIIKAVTVPMNAYLSQAQLAAIRGEAAGGSGPEQSPDCRLEQINHPQAMVRGGMAGGGAGDHQEQGGGGTPSGAQASLSPANSLLESPAIRLVGIGSQIKAESLALNGSDRFLPKAGGGHPNGTSSLPNSHHQTTAAAPALLGLQLKAGAIPPAASTSARLRRHPALMASSEGGVGGSGTIYSELSLVMDWCRVRIQWETLLLQLQVRGECERCAIIHRTALYCWGYPSTN